MLKKNLLIIFLNMSLSAAEEAGHKSSAPGAVTCIYNIGKLINMGAQIYENNYPDNEKKAAINKARDVNEFFTSKKEFRNCLIKNAKAPRNTAGRPIACEDLAVFFALIAGKPQLDEMTENFKIAYEE